MLYRLTGVIVSQYHSITNKKRIPITSKTFFRFPCNLLIYNKKKWGTFKNNCDTVICDYDIYKRQIFNELQLRLFLTRPWNRTKSISFWHKNGSKSVLKPLVLILFPLLLEREYVQKLHINITKQGYIVTIVGSREQHLHPRGHRTCSLLGETNGYKKKCSQCGNKIFPRWEYFLPSVGIFCNP